MNTNNAQDWSYHNAPPIHGRMPIPMDIDNPTVTPAPPLEPVPPKERERTNWKMGDIVNEPNASFEDIDGHRFSAYTTSTGQTFIVKKRHGGGYVIMDNVRDWNNNILRYWAVNTGLPDDEDEEMPVEEEDEEMEMDAYGTYKRKREEGWWVPKRKRQKLEAIDQLIVTPPKQKRSPSTLLLPEGVEYPHGKKARKDQSPATWRDLAELMQVPGGNIPVDELPGGTIHVLRGSEKHPRSAFLGLGPRNAGPWNTVSSYDEAVAEGPVELAAWYHDLAYSAANNNSELLKAADDEFLWKLNQVPPEQRDLKWFLARTAINYGLGRVKQILFG